MPAAQEPKGPFSFKAFFKSDFDTSCRIVKIKGTKIRNYSNKTPKMENKKTVGGCQLPLNYVFTNIKKND